MSFVGLYTGLSGIRAGQAGLDAASNNIANANTPGYTRQRVEFAAAQTFRSAYGPVGTGVRVEDVARLRDAFLDTRLRSAVGDQASNAVQSEFLASLERLSGEPDLGLSSKIGELWAAAEDWSNDPANPAARRQVLTEMASIAEGFRATADAWSQLGADTTGRLDVTVDQVNDTLASLEDLNTRLANADPTRIGPDTLDQRDQLLDRLASLTGATVRYEGDNTVTVSLGGSELLSHENGRAVVSIGDAPGAAPGDPAAVLVTPVGGGAVRVEATGEVEGLRAAVHEQLPTWLGQLDDLATTLATAINELNEAGVTADGESGGALFDFDVNNAASSLRLATNDIAALAAATTGDPGTPPAAFDGSNARALADLRTTLVDVPGGGGEQATLENQLSDLVVGLAGAVRTAANRAESAGGIAKGAAMARSSQHGVSIDEEMVDLVRFQRALEAAARVMTTVDQALDTLVNRVGIVGR